MRFSSSAARNCSRPRSGIDPGRGVHQGRAAGAQAFNGPLGIAFDAQATCGWTNNGGATIVEIAAAVLNAAAGMTPVASAHGAEQRDQFPAASPRSTTRGAFCLIAAATCGSPTNSSRVSGCSGTVVEFTAAAIAGGGVITPAPNRGDTVKPRLGGLHRLCDPNGITMNKAGNIVVANAAGNSLAEYTASQITSSGNPTPHTFVVGLATLLNGPAGLTYGPVSLK